MVAPEGVGKGKPGLEAEDGAFAMDGVTEVGKGPHRM